MESIILFTGTDKEDRYNNVRKIVSLLHLYGYI